MSHFDDFDGRVNAEYEVNCPKLYEVGGEEAALVVDMLIVVMVILKMMVMAMLAMLMVVMVEMVNMKG